MFILCPVPDLRFKKDWNDKEELAANIINDFSSRINFNVSGNIITKKILTPEDWADMLNLYQGSGLGLAIAIPTPGVISLTGIVLSVSG